MVRVFSGWRGHLVADFLLLVFHTLWCSHSDSQEGDPDPYSAEAVNAFLRATGILMKILPVVHVS